MIISLLIHCSICFNLSLFFLVLQRFYHQQNQLREKELERQQYQQQSHHTFYNKHSPSSISDSTNPFHTNLYQAASSPQQQQQQHFGSHIPVASSSTLSSYSTSSQSSTQSSQCSQIGGSGSGVGELSSPSNTQQHQGPRSLPLMSNYDNKFSPSPTSPPTPHHPQVATMGFGTTTSPTLAATTSNTIGHLQYQPLPQQYLTNTPIANVMRSSRSPPTSPPENFPDSGINSGGSGSNQRMGVTSPTVTKLSKLYNQRHMPQGNINSPAPACLTNANNAVSGGTASKENNFKPESGKRFVSFFLYIQALICYTHILLLGFICCL